ncbi:MAG: hypothetical protein QOJ61_3601 [Mycobacterium sp.]|jgi:hypothetical protein|nr:hypothetical protein [Mycobacterium sp.]
MLSWAVIGYGAALSAVLGTAPVALAAVLLGFGPVRADPARRLASLAVLAGLGALLVDIYLY